jgi:SiaC family regulatory phosphoprotein
MRPMKINGTEEQPTIILDRTSSRFEFHGKSMLEDARAFFKPVMEWIDEYAENPNERTEIVYKMTYFNTSSSKLILDMMRKFATIYQNGHDIEVHWYYFEDDEDMLEAGEIYAERVKVPMKLINCEY